MATKTVNHEEAITEAVNNLSKREVLFSYAVTFDKISRDISDSINALSHNKKELAALDERVLKIVSTSYTKPEKVVEDFNKARVSQRLAMVETMMTEPEKLGNLKKDHTLDMLKTQKIGMDYKFQAERRVENTIKSKTSRGDIKRHADQVWTTAQKFERDNEYNEFVRAKTPAEKLESRLVKGYLADQAALKQLVANAPVVALDALKEKKIDFNGKLRPHATVRSLQERAGREQGQSQTQTRQRSQSRQRSMNM